MSEDTLPGAAQEAPETFRVLLAPLWPRLPLAIGYSGAARWLALYVSSDHVIYNDGTGLATGDTSLRESAHGWRRATRMGHAFSSPGRTAMQHEDGPG